MSAVPVHRNLGSGKVALDDGAREPILFLPGMLCDADLWSEVVGQLPPDRDTRFLQIDQEPTILGSASALLRDAPPTFALVGHSLGGIVAQQMALLAPERVTAMVLFGTSPLAPTADQRAAWKSLLGMLEADSFDDIADQQPAALLPAHRVGDAHLAKRVREMALAVGPERLRRQLAMQQSRTDLRHALARFQRTALVLCGTADHVCPPDRQRELARALPHGEFVEMDRLGHLAPMEDPTTVGGALLCGLAM